MRGTKLLYSEKTFVTSKVDARWFSALLEEHDGDIPIKRKSTIYIVCLQNKCSTHTPDLHKFE